ncbi:MAG: hypothetical protein H6710_19605 [Myxococcales bacterium]|nr:hypothetical protein [Myxococcales bacterium]
MHRSTLAALASLALLACDTPASSRADAGAPGEVPATPASASAEVSDRQPGAAAAPAIAGARCVACAVRRRRGCGRRRR